MIRFKSVVILLALASYASMSSAQSEQPSVKPPSTGGSSSQAATSAVPSAPASSIPADAPVITIEGICEVSLNGLPKAPPRSATTAKATVAKASTSSHPECKTQVTRAQFEQLLKTVAPNVPPAMRRQVAASYVQALTAANEGVKMGVDKDPDFSEQLALMRLQLLARDAAVKVQADASKVSDAEIKSYYDQNPSAFEEATLTRIFIPRPTGEATKDQPAPDVKTIADNAHQQLVSGGDAEKIQKTIFEQLKMTSEPPSTKFGAKRRGTLPPAHEQKIFALKPGESSEVIQDSFGAVIYRVDGRQELPLDQVKDQVRAKLTQQRIEDARRKIMSGSKADYNDAYFGPETSAAGPKPGQPPVPSAARPKVDGTPNTSPATGAAPSPTQPANPKK